MFRRCVVVALYAALVVLLLTLGIIAKDTQNCPLNATVETELREPIILTNSTGKLEFYIPSIDNGSLIFDQDREFIFLCPNPRNSILTGNGPISTGFCANGLLKVDGKLQPFQELSCNKSIRGDVRQRTGTPCGIRGDKHGTVIDIGYYVEPTDGRRDFLPLIEVCHDEKQGNTYYSMHLIHGKLVKYASKSSYRPGFSTQGLQIPGSIGYKQAYQKATFGKLLGSAVLADRYINSKSFLARGHLAPDADFLFAPWQFSTYFLINAAPQWQAINAGNWYKLEMKVRKLADQLEADLRIVTGTHGLLTLTTTDNTTAEMFLLLPQKALPVPKFIWKLVYSPTTKQAIVAVILNNPFVKSLAEAEFVCEDICARHRWSDDNWAKLDKGRVHCCDYRSFVNVVHTVPDFDVVDVLQGPKES